MAGSMRKGTGINEKSKCLLPYFTTIGEDSNSGKMGIFKEEFWNL
jgi:hypothetical protein